MFLGLSLPYVIQLAGLFPIQLAGQFPLLPSLLPSAFSAASINHRDTTSLVLISGSAPKSGPVQSTRFGGVAAHRNGTSCVRNVRIGPDTAR